jgi:hypothetical protein
MNIESFKKNLNLETLPRELEALIRFDTEQAQSGYFSESFELMIDNKSGIATWCNNPEFLNKLYPFAQANGSGSIYAIWDDGAGKALNEMPVVVFGDEGGVHPVAENFTAFLQLLTYDVEISVSHERVYFYKDEESYEESTERPLYLQWLKENFNLDPVTDTKPILETAQLKYKQRFDEWMNSFTNT